MDPIIVAAGIGGAATILAAGISAYAFWRKKDRARKSEPLGDWIATWTYEADGTTNETRVTLALESDGRIRGEGHGGASPYKIEGFDSPFATAFAYKALDPKQKTIVGVFIVRKWPDHRMTGNWYQLSANNELDHGEVILIRP